MKLGEALKQRSDFLKRMSELQVRVQKNAVVQEGEDPAEAPQPLLAELDRLGGAVLSLIQRINRTNVGTRLAGEDGTIADAIAKREHLGRMRAHAVAIADAASITLARTTRAEIKYRRTFDVAAVRRSVDDLAKAQRELDVRIQQANWTTDLVD